VSQVWVFTYLPYVALGIGIAGCAWRLTSGRVTEAGSGRRRAAARIFGRSRAWLAGIAVTLAGHVLALLLPRQLLVWNESPVRLLLLELTGLAFGCLALAGLAANLRAYWRKVPDRPLTRLDAVVLTLVVAVLASGLGVALLHRWGSSWAAVTVVPWVYSLLRLDPEPQWMASLPFLARLHALGVLALLAVWPFSSFGALLGRVRTAGRPALAGSS
jgi:nitrate reductase gamma subunit